MSTVTVHRVQLSRRAGWRLPANTVSVAWPTRWANPFRPPHRGVEVNRVAVQQYEAYVLSRPDLMAALPELAGWNLACWCPPTMLWCHAGVLLRLANPTAIIGEPVAA